MSVEEDIFHHKQVKLETLEPYGFVKQNNEYSYTYNFQSANFRAEIIIDESGSLKSKVIDQDMEEEFVLLHINAQIGSFLSAVKEEYQEVLEDIANHCFETTPFQSKQANHIAQWIKTTYNDSLDFPFQKESNYGLFRHFDNQKWYALFMEIEKNKIMPAEEGEVIEVVNLKVEPSKMKQLLEIKGIYPGYHMNHKSWISVVLDGTVNNETIHELIAVSHALTASKTVQAHAWLIPANPAYYDIVSEIQNSEDKTFVWKQTSHIHTGDTTFLYLAAPVSAILYRCKVLETDIAYPYEDENIKMKKVMKLQVEKEYEPDVFPYLFLKENKLGMIRGQRSISESIIQKMKEVAGGRY